MDCDVSRGVFQGPGTSSFFHWWFFLLSGRTQSPMEGKEEVVEGWYISFKSWFLTVSLQDLIMRCTIETKVSSPQRLFLNLIFSFSTPTHSLSSGSSLRSTEREWALTRKTKIRFETDLFLFLSVAYFLFNKKTMTNGDRGKRKSARHPRPKVAHRDSREKLHLRVSVWVSGGNV